MTKYKVENPRHDPYLALINVLRAVMLGWPLDCISLTSAGLSISKYRSIVAYIFNHKCIDIYLISTS